MTKHEAVRILELYNPFLGGDDKKLLSEAIDVAIEALQDHSADPGKKVSFSRGQENDMVYRQAAIDAKRYTFGNDEFSLEAAYHDCKLVFDGITDDDSFQEADTGLILYYANEIIYALHEALDKRTKERTETHSCDLISRAMLLEYIHNEPVGKMLCDKYNLDGVIKQFPSAQPDVPDTNVGDMIYRQAAVDAIDALHDKPNAWLDYAVDAVMALPSAEPERKKGRWIERNPQNSDTCRLIECDQCGFSHIVGFNVPYEHWIENRNFCERCGADMRKGEGEKE